MSVETATSQASEKNMGDAVGCLTSLYGKPRIGFFSPSELSDEQTLERKRACLSLAALIYGLHEAKELSSQILISSSPSQGETLSQFLSHAWLGEKGCQERLQAIDRSHVEMVIVWLWIFGNTDKEGKNIQVHPQNGLIYCQPVYGLQIIDYSCLLPLNNRHLMNPLPDQFPLIRTLSPMSREFILNLPLKQALTILRSHHLDRAVDAFSDRIKALQSMVQKGLTIQEINDRLNHLDCTPDLQLSSYPHVGSLTQTGAQWQRV